MVKVEKEFLKKPLQEDIAIILEDVERIFGKMANWKVAEPDFVQGFRFKKLTGQRDYNL